MEINYKDYKYSTKEEMREKLRWGHQCKICWVILEKENCTIVDDKSGYNDTLCDLCSPLVGKVSFPWDHWTDDQKALWKRDGYLTRDLFDENRNLRHDRKL